MRTLVTGFGAAGYSGWSHLETVHVITFAEVLFLNKAILTGSRG